MNKYLVIVVAVFALACKHEKATYYTYGHWLVPGDENRVPLKATPKEVKETLFVDLNDTTLDATGKLKNYDTWRFDDQGNITYRKSFFSDTVWTETNRSYNDSGLQSATRYADGKNPSQPAASRSLATQPLSDGRFKELATGPDGTKIRLVSFRDSGNVQTIEFVAGTDIKKTYGKQVIRYKNDLIQSLVQINRHGDSTVQHYMYSKNNFTDSIVQIDNGKFFSKVIYINNSYGDPIQAYTILANGDTMNSSAMRYLYDPKGNWLKKLERITVSNDYPSIPGYKETRYALLVREIKY